MTEKRVQRRLAAILAADVVGFSRLMERDEAGTLDALKSRRQAVLSPVVAQHNGRVVKLMGDGVLVEFASAVDAVQCAVELQRGFDGANRGVVEAKRIVLRIGINLGDIIVEGSDIYGEGVNVAARLEALAEPGGIYVSASVHDQVTGKLSLAFGDLGEHTLKNILKPVRVYGVQSDGADKSTARPKLARPGTSVPSKLMTAPAKGTIAVLPFANLGSDAEQNYFAEGIAEDILTELSRFRHLFVIARNSSFSFKGKGLGVQDIARELNVEYIVSGSVRRAGNRVRVAAQLINTETGQEIWAEHYDRELEDIFNVQDEVVRTIVVTLEARLGTTMANIVSRRKTPSMAAYECVLLAVKYLGLHDPSQAMPYAERALELDASYPQAHAIVATACFLKYLEDPQPEMLEKALSAARKSVVLDDSDSRGHAILGMTLLSKRNYELAGTHLERAISLNPADTIALAYRAYWLLVTGNAEQALAAMDQILTRDPIPPIWHWDIRANALVMLRRYDQAILAMTRLANLFWYNHVYLAICHARLGQSIQTRVELEKVLQLRPTLTIRQYILLEEFQRQDDLEFLAEGLRLAGLPE